MAAKSATKVCVCVCMCVNMSERFPLIAASHLPRARESKMGERADGRRTDGWMSVVGHMEGI